MVKLMIGKLDHDELVKWSGPILFFTATNSVAEEFLLLGSGCNKAAASRLQAGSKSNVARKLGRWIQRRQLWHSLGMRNIITRVFKLINPSTIPHNSLLFSSLSLSSLQSKLARALQVCRVLFFWSARFLNSPSHSCWSSSFIHQVPGLMCCCLGRRFGVSCCQQVL